MTDLNKRKLTLKLRALLVMTRLTIEKLKVMRTEPDINVVGVDRTIADLERTMTLTHVALSAISNIPSLTGDPAPSGAREYVEMTNVEEYRKFQGLPPISDTDLANVDLDELISKLR
tara:strand:- start:1542 stop:1892 length:351 start_codon:yes stop_codon:yes gene_type:complete